MDTLYLGKILLIPVVALTLCVLSANAGQLRVAILDTGLDLTDKRFESVLCKEGHKDFTGEGIQDDIGHGTHVAGLIKQYAKNSDYCLIIIKNYGDKTGPVSIQTNNDIYQYMSGLNLDVVNYSGGGPQFIKSEYLFMKKMVFTRFFVAVGNEGKDIRKVPYYPASYNFSNIVKVGNVTEYGEKAIKSNYSPYGMKWEIGENVVSTVPFKKALMGVAKMSGTSMATAIATGKYIYNVKYIDNIVKH